MITYTLYILCDLRRLICYFVGDKCVYFQIVLVDIIHVLHQYFYSNTCIAPQQLDGS